MKTRTAASGTSRSITAIFGPHVDHGHLWIYGTERVPEEKHEPVSDIDTIVVDSLKALDPEWPIREATLLFGVAR